MPDIPDPFLTHHRHGLYNPPYHGVYNPGHIGHERPPAKTQAYCLYCSWMGPERDTVEEARADGVQHEEDAGQ